MKYLWDVSSPSTDTIRKWFESELERRNIDVDIHAKYVVSMVEDEDYCDECISGPNCSNKNKDKSSILRRYKTFGIDAHWPYSPVRDLAIEILQNASNSDLNVSVELLVDQLREKLVRDYRIVSEVEIPQKDPNNGNPEIMIDDSQQLKNLELKFEQLSALWRPQNEPNPFGIGNWFGSASSDSGLSSPRAGAYNYDDALFRAFGPIEDDGRMSHAKNWIADQRNAVDIWMKNQDNDSGPNAYLAQLSLYQCGGLPSWMMTRRCSLDNHLSTSLFKEVTSKKLEVSIACNHHLPNVPDVHVFDENLLTSHKTHFQPIKNDSWQREISCVIDNNRKGLVPCSPQCPNRVTGRSNSSENRLGSIPMVEPPRPSSVSSKELASFMEPGCVDVEGDPEVEEEEDGIEKFVVVEEEIRDELMPVPQVGQSSVVVVVDVGTDEEEENDDESDETEYQAIESILNEVLNNRSVDEYEEAVDEEVKECHESTSIVTQQLDSNVVSINQAPQVTTITTNDTYSTSMPAHNHSWNEDLLSLDLNTQIMTAETVYLTDDSDDYFYHPTSSDDVDSSLSDIHNDPALLFVYSRPAGGQPSNTMNGSSGQYSKPCSFFLEGNCRKSDCKYSHDFKSIQCKFWLEGSCFKGDSCPFLHSADLSLPGGPCDEPSPPLKDFSMNDMDFPSLAVESSKNNGIRMSSLQSASTCRESDTSSRIKSNWLNSGSNTGSNTGNNRTRTNSTRESPPLPVTFRLQVGRKKRKKGGSHPKGV